MIDVRLYITFLVRSLLYRTFIHDIKPFPSLPSPLLEVFLDFCWLAKHFHSRRVSSAAADATNCPSGDMVMWRMRDMCPVNSMTRDMAGYFQIVSWFWEKPWPETNSLYSLDHISAQTWLFVSTLLRQDPVFAFQNLIWRSAVPPPLARTFGCHGHHATAWRLMYT